jgi:uridylate kinase
MVSSSVFLTKKDNENLKKWKYAVNDNSITTSCFNPLWNFLVNLVPKTVAPNVLTLAGFMFVVYAFYLCYYHVDEHPNFASFIVCAYTFAYMNLDAIDGKHARKIRNSSPLGELFDHSCDNTSVVFSMASLCMVLGIKNLETQLYIVNTAQLVFLNSHIDAFRKRIVEFGKFTGPGEALVVYLLVTLACGIFGNQWVYTVVDFVKEHVLNGSNYQVFPSLYVIMMVYTIFNAVTLGKKHYSTRNRIVFALITNMIPFLMIQFNIMHSELTIIDVVGHGLSMAILTGDMIVAKMTSRELHPLIPLMMVGSLFSSIIGIGACITYYVLVFDEIKRYLRLPLLGVVQNIYCNGVYDLTHLEHMNAFKFAAQQGNRLIVGVHNDEDVKSYKREPNLDHHTRCKTVRACKYVDEVIPNAPLKITREFVIKHNIHHVVYSDEYDNDDDEWYKVAKDMGIHIIKPRGQGTSTSSIMKRVAENHAKCQKKKDEMKIDDDDDEDVSTDSFSFDRRIVVKIGGTIFYPNHINIALLRDLRIAIGGHIHNTQFIVVVGGGKGARLYQNAIKECLLDHGHDVPDIDKKLDLIGIDVTKLNAQMFGHIFGARVLNSIDDAITDDDEVVIASGYEPGHSTDYDAMYLARKWQADKVIVLSNITQIHTADPNTDPNAEPLDEISWKDLKKMVGTDWSPGSNVPMDTTAVDIGLDSDIEVVFAGRHMDNFERILDGEEYIGTRIICEANM